MRTRRRHELANIKLLGDFNELAISGHVEHGPVLREDDDHQQVCKFVLTHTTTSPSGHWELPRYNVQAYGQLGEHYATAWQPGQAIVINGRLEYHVCDTLAGPIRTPRSSPTPSTPHSDHTRTPTITNTTTRNNLLYILASGYEAGVACPRHRQESTARRLPCTRSLTGLSASTRPLLRIPASRSSRILAFQGVSSSLASVTNASRSIPEASNSIRTRSSPAVHRSAGWRIFRFILELRSKHLRRISERL